MPHVPFTVHFAGNEGCTGIAIETVLMAVVNQQNGTVTQKPMVAVLWDDEKMRSPAPSFHSPSELVWLTVPGIVEPEEDDEEEEDEDEVPEADDDSETPTEDGTIG